MDRATKVGVLNKPGSIKISIPVSIQQVCRILEGTIWFQLKREKHTFIHPADYQWCKKIIPNLYNSSLINLKIETKCL